MAISSLGLKGHWTFSSGSGSISILSVGQPLLGYQVPEAVKGWGKPAEMYGILYYVSDTGCRGGKGMFCSIGQHSETLSTFSSLYLESCQRAGTHSNDQQMGGLSGWRQYS